MNEQLVVREKKALELVPMSRTKFRELLESGAIPSFHVGRARFIPFDGLKNWVTKSVTDQACSRPTKTSAAGLRSPRH